MEPCQPARPGRFITVGEVLLRLTPPNYDAIQTANCFNAFYGGSEANIAVGLANLGVDSTVFTVVPDNSLGKGALRMLRSNNVNCTPAILSGPAETPTHRLGTYYLETGFGVRSSRVVYDRKHSAFAEYDYRLLDVERLLDSYDWLHLSGITPALGKNCADLVMTCLRVAREKGMTISFDGNFRSALWSWDEARDFCTRCLPYVDVLLGVEPYHLWRDEADHTKGDWKDGIPLQPSPEQQAQIFDAFAARYPNLKYMARHVRYAESGSENSLKAYLWHQGTTWESRSFTFAILDRVGGGDAFASGLIYAIMHGYKPREIVDFAVSSSVLKHTIRGDCSIIDDVQAIDDVMNQSHDIKR